MIQEHSTTNNSAVAIHGNEIAKRAVIVAAAGSHSLMVLGYPKTGKTLLRRLAKNLGLTDTDESLPCPCGWLNHREINCFCTEQEIKQHLGELPSSDICVAVRVPTIQQMKSSGTSLADMQQQISEATNYTSIEFTEYAENQLLRVFDNLNCNDLTLSRISQVARTIANLERSLLIQPSHVSEAVNYQSFLC